MKRFKSYGFWTALSGAVVIFLNALGDCFGFSIDNDLVSGLIMAFAGVLVVLGVVSMPKKDDSSENKTDEQENNENNINNEENSSNNDENDSEDFSSGESNRDSEHKD